MLPGVPYEVRRCIIDDKLVKYSREHRELCRLYLTYEEKYLLGMLAKARRQVDKVREKKYRFQLMRVRLLRTLINDSLELDRAFGR